MDDYKIGFFTNYILNNRKCTNCEIIGIFEFAIYLVHNAFVAAQFKKNQYWMCILTRFLHINANAVRMRCDFIASNCRNFKCKTTQ